MYPFSGKHYSSHLHGYCLKSFMDWYVLYVGKEGANMAALCIKLIVDLLEADGK
jgi:hypothetical protein